MRIDLDNKYFIECTDGMNVNLCENTIDKKKEPSVKVLGYYGTVAMACKAALELKLKKSDEKCLDELINFIIRSKAEIIAAVKNAQNLNTKINDLEDFLG